MINFYSNPEDYMKGASLTDDQIQERKAGILEGLEKLRENKD